jgi:cell pole-organizing protein PopZ
MDDILASIRRILNEDEAPPSATAGKAPADPPAANGPAANGPADDPGAEPEEAEPLDLTESMMVQPARPEEPTPVAEPVLPVVATPAPALTPETLVAPAVAAATTAAVGQLLRAVAQERGAAVHRGGPTIEEVVREELRPLLKDWLDQHLPPLVERLVRAEIERVVGRGLP